MTTSEQPTTEDTLKAGREALERSAWREAFELLSAADVAGHLEAEDLERLGDAAMWALKPQECIGAYERAYAAYVQSGNRRQAVSTGVRLLAELNTQGSDSVAAGWLSRLVRLLKEEPECVEHGLLGYVQAQVYIGLGDLDGALATAQQAFDIARKFEDRDLEALALHTQGLALVSKGDVAEGMALLDEAAAAAVAGELGLLASATIYCNIVGACRGLADYNRASEWIDAAKRWCERTALDYYPGTCRVNRAEVMRLRGVWAEAEEDAQKACDELRLYPVMAREAFYELGEIRLRTGDLKGAEEAFGQAHEMGRDPQPGLALVRLAQGQAEAAGAMIRRALLEQDKEQLARARMLPAQVEIAIALADLETARSAVEELETVAGKYDTTVLHATALCSRAALQLADGDFQSALTNLRLGLRLWQEIDAPYEVARARLCAAAAYRASGDEQSARLELESARSTFERLGARLAALHARELLKVGSAAAGRSPARIRATKTFMFTDIVKSTDLMEAMGDDAWDSLLDWHDQRLRSLFAEHTGEEIKHGGDGFFVAFEEAERAIECALAIQRGLQEHRRDHGFAPQVRIGVHTGDARRRGDDYFGRGVNCAARIGAVASAGEIFASQDTVASAGGAFSTSEPRSLALKGIARPVQVVAIDWR